MPNDYDDAEQVVSLAQLAALHGVEVAELLGCSAAEFGELLQESAGLGVLARKRLRQEHHAATAPPVTILPSAASEAAPMAAPAPPHAINGSGALTPGEATAINSRGRSINSRGHAPGWHDVGGPAQAEAPEPSHAATVRWAPLPPPLN
jgi:hypothetical protein